MNYSHAESRGREGQAKTAITYLLWRSSRCLGADKLLDAEGVGKSGKADDVGELDGDIR
jgi:hypothetical protein